MRTRQHNSLTDSITRPPRRTNRRSPVSSRQKFTTSRPAATPGTAQSHQSTAVSPHHLITRSPSHPLTRSRHHRNRGQALVPVIFIMLILTTLVVAFEL